MIVWGLFLSVAMGVGWVYWFLGGKPTIAINYVQRYNDLTRPSPYDPNDNAWPIYQKAIAALKPMPEYWTWIKRDRNEIEGSYFMFGSPSRTAPMLKRGGVSMVTPASIPLAAPNTPGLDPEYFRFDTAQDCYYVKTHTNWPNWPGDFDPNNVGLFTEWIQSNQQVYHYLSEASSKSCFWIEREPYHPLFQITDNLDEFDGLNDCRELLGWVAKWNAFRQNPDGILGPLDLIECMNDFLDTTHLLHYLADDILWRHRICRCILTIVNNQTLSEDTLVKLQRHLETHRSTQQLSIECERMCAQDLIQRVFTDNRRGSGRFLAGEYMKLFQIHISGLDLDDLFDPDQWKYCSEETSFRNQLYRASLFGEDRQHLLQRLEQVLSDTSTTLTLSPADLQARGMDLQTIASLYPYPDPQSRLSDFWSGGVYYYHRVLHHSWERPTIAILALHRYRLRTGQFPDSLEKLVETGYLKELPPDPYSNNPLVYRRTPEGFTLYSIGRNRMDDGGEAPGIPTTPALPQTPFQPKQTPVQGDIIIWPIPKGDGNPYMRWSMDGLQIAM